LAFSPDSRFLAFDRPPFDEPEQRDVFVLAVDGSREIPVVVHPATDTVVGWSLDGKKLLFTSDRTGSTGIWGVALEDGKPQGPPDLVKANTGGMFPLGLTRSGALYFGVRVGGPDVYLTSIDFNSGKVLSAPAPVAQQWVHANNQPDWSSDGKYLAFHIVPASPGGQNKVIIQSMETGKTRELQPRLRYFQSPRWSPDGTAFVVQGTDFKGRQGIFRIDALNGDIELLIPRKVNAGSTFPVWSPDGKRIYYWNQIGLGDEAILEWTLASGAERELLHRKQVVRQSLSVSPDGRYLSFVGNEPTGKESALTIVPVTGGDARAVFTLPMGGGFTAWSSDGHSLLFTKNISPTGDNGSEVWTIPLIGGQPQKLDLGAGEIRGLRVQPGGNGLAFFRLTGGGNLEVWALENFLPASKASK
jgi:Tol biopolymer transport system component